jgi:hypothetical protein
MINLIDQGGTIVWFSKLLLLCMDIVVAAFAHMDMLKLCESSDDKIDNYELL